MDLMEMEQRYRSYPHGPFHSENLHTYDNLLKVAQPQLRPHSSEDRAVVS